LTAGATCATLASPLALAQLDQDAAAAQSTTTVPVGKTPAKKEVAPFKKTDTAPFEVMKQAMIKVIQQKAAQPQPAIIGAQKKAVQKARVQVKGELAAQAMVVQMNVEGQLQQLIQQSRPILRAEYHVLRVVCQLTTEQRKTMARAAEQTLRDSTKKYFETMRRPMTAAQRAALDPRRLIQEGLSQAVKAKLSAEQSSRYQEELAKRTAGRKQLAVRNLVARLDRDMLLNAEQRDRIADSLLSHWDDAWCQSLEMFMHDNNYLPPIPDHYVAPILNESQKKIWRTTQRIQVFFGGMRVMMGGDGGDDASEDPELREARLIAEAQDNAGENSEKAQKKIEQIQRFRGMMEKVEVQEKFQKAMEKLELPVKTKAVPKK
jgi:hypothetical protein